MNLLSGVLLVLLAALCAYVVIEYTTPKTNTAIVTVSYQRATLRENGTPLLLEELKYTRLFCDDKLVAEEAGADGDISAELTGGLHRCYGTHVDNNDRESAPSGAVVKLVEL